MVGVEKPHDLRPCGHPIDRTIGAIANIDRATGAHRAPVDLAEERARTRDRAGAEERLWRPIEGKDVYHPITDRRWSVARTGSCNLRVGDEYRAERRDRQLQVTPKLADPAAGRAER